MNMAGKRFTLNEVLNLLEDDTGFQEASIFMTGPEDATKSDEDSGDEDLGGNINNLTGNQLRADASVSVRNATGSISNLTNREDSDTSGDEESEASSGSVSDASDSTLDYDVQLPMQQNQNEQRMRIAPRRERRQPAPRRRWIRQDIPNAQRDRHSAWNYGRPEFFDRDWEPYLLFELFFDDEVCLLIKDQSTNYARHQGNHTFQISIEEVRLFLAMLLVSGYANLPRRRMYWEQQPDTKIEAFCNAMSRKRFEEILKYLHVCDNNQLNQNDKMSKIRPLYSLINDRCLQYFPMEQDLSIDESMIPYFGKHSAKQFIRGKPIRFGFKLWCLTTRLGYLIQFEPYQGAGAGRHELGMGAGVVLDLISELPEAPYRLYFDNLFTSVKLLDRLTEMGIGGTGTLRSNRIEKCPLTPARQMLNMARGVFDYRYDEHGQTLIVEWNDNNIVYMGTNCHKVTPANRVQRWSKRERRIVEVQQPKVIAEYNRCMGGVDRMDQNINSYRIGIRIKKWWWALFAFIPDMVVQNAWILYRLSTKYQVQPFDLLDFRREICKIYLMRYSQRAVRGRPVGRVLNIDRRVPAAVRQDSRDHYIAPINTQRRCAYCGGKSTRICVKCNVGLHDRCFIAFHHQ